MLNNTKNNSKINSNKSVVSTIDCETISINDAQNEKKNTLQHISV